MPKTKNKGRAEEISSGTAQTRKRERAVNKFSQMLSPKSKSADNVEGADQETPRQKPPEQMQQPIVIIEKEQEILDMDRGKSVDSLGSQFNDDPSSSQRKSVEPPSGGIQRRSSSLMELDDSVRDIDYFDSLDRDNQRESQSKSGTYLTKVEFDYTMNLLDTKIGAVYKLCRFIGDKQKEDSKSLKRLVALDELSEDFWNRANREVVKKLLPDVLFPSVSDFRKVLEDYLGEHADHFIESIGRNSWISMFEDKLLPEIKNKCRSKRNDIASSIRHAMFINFGDRLEYIDNSASAAKIVEWKSSDRTKAAYESLYNAGNYILTDIGSSVFKQYKSKDLPATHCAYIVAICDILLNPKSPGIKCNDKSVVRRVSAFLSAYDKNEPVTPEIMGQIADEEAEAAMDASKRRKDASQTGGNETQFEDEDDYDTLISGLDRNF